MTMEPTFPCFACGFLTLGEEPGSYEICHLCKWQDDPVQLTRPRLRGGANRESLVEAQRAAIERFPLGQQSAGTYQRDPEWRPLTEEEAEVSEKMPRSGLAYFHAAADAGPITYYWRTLRN